MPLAESNSIVLGASTVSATDEYVAAGIVATLITVGASVRLRHSSSRFSVGAKAVTVVPAELVRTILSTVSLKVSAFPEGWSSANSTTVPLPPGGGFPPFPAPFPPHVLRLTHHSRIKTLEQSRT